MNTATQETRILNYLRLGRGLTPLSALKQFGCLRLGARIYDLRLLGHDIRREWFITPAGKRVALYRLVNHNG